MLTAHGTIDLAVTAMKNGAYDFIQKEENTIILQHIVEKALDNQRLRKEVEKLRLENQEILNYQLLFQILLKCLKL